MRRNQQSQISPDTKAIIAQQAAQDFSRIVQEVQSVYFAQLQQMAQIGVSGSAAYAAPAMLQSAQTNASMLGAMSTFGGTTIALAGAPLLGPFAPALGGVVAAAGNYFSNQMIGEAQLQATKMQIMAQQQSMLAQISAMSGGAGNPTAMPFMQGLPLDNPMIAAQRAALYNSIDTGTIPFGFGNLNSILQSTVSPISPYGSNEAAGRIAMSMNSLSQMTVNSMGMSAPDYIMRSAGISFRNVETEGDFYARLRSGGVNASGRDVEEIWGRYKGRFGGALSADDFAEGIRRGVSDKGRLSIPYETEEGTYEYPLQISQSDRELLYRTLRGGGGIGIDNEQQFRNYATSMAYMGGRGALQQLRGAVGQNAQALGILGEIEGGGAKTYQETLLSAQEMVSQSQRLYASGNAAGAAAVTGQVAGLIGSAANTISSAAITPEMRVQAEQLRVQQIQQEALAAEQRFASYAPGLAMGYGAGAAGLQRFGLFGDAAGLQAGSQAMVAASQADIGRMVDRLQGPTTPEQQAQLYDQINQKMREQVQVLDQVNRGMITLSVSVGQTEMSLAGGGYQRSVMGGGGAAATQAGLGFIGAIQHEQHNYAQAASTYGALLRQQGVDPRTNPFYQQLTRQADQMQTMALQQSIGLVNAPLDINTREELAQNQFSMSVLQNIPGAYGSLTGAMRSRMGLLEGSAEQHEQRRRAMMAAGSWGEGQEFAYRNQMRSIGAEQAGLFGQLSVGWESRLMSQAINMPGEVSFAAPALSMMAAVTSGVTNPLFGSRQQSLPFFLRQAQNMGSLAGTTGTPEGLGVSALNGDFSDLKRTLTGGIRVVIEEVTPDGGRRARTGRAYFSDGSQNDTSPSALAETMNLMGAMR